MTEQDPSICRKVSESRLTYLVFVHLVSRLWVFNVCIVSIEVRRIIIEHVTVGCTLGHVTQTLLLQMTKHLLERLSSSKLELAVYGDGVMSVTSIVIGFHRTGGRDASHMAL
jgi:hypothetical protein